MSLKSTAPAVNLRFKEGLLIMSVAYATPNDDTLARLATNVIARLEVMLSRLEGATARIEGFMPTWPLDTAYSKVDRVIARLEVLL